MGAQSPPATSSPSAFAFTAPPHAGCHAHFFQPPKSPAYPSAGTTSSFTSAAEADFFTSGSRKRLRADSSRGTGMPPTLTAATTATPTWAQCPTPSDGSYISAYEQDSTLVNERYMLAGGCDTPSLMAMSQVEQRPLHVGPLARERNGVGRVSSSASSRSSSGHGNSGASSSWAGLAFSLVGKVFTFGSSVIKGFYAGGGQGYELQGSELAGHGGSWARTQARCSTPLPGAWQDDDFLGDFEQDDPLTPTARPAAKRRQTDRDAWIMVSTPDLTESGLRRKAAAPATTAPRSSLAARPAASRASSRRSLAPVLHRRQSSASSHTYTTGSPAPHHHQHHPPAAPATPLGSPTRSASFAPMRSRSRPSSGGGGGGGGGVDGSNNFGAMYVSPEAERYVKRRARQDKQADAAMSDMSRKLADLIRQGQEALGTKISIEEGGGGGAEEDIDEGFVDEDW